MGEGEVLLPVGAWLAATAALSWLAPARWRPLAMIAGGAGVLAILSWPSLLYLAAATVFTFRLARGPASRTPLMLAGVAAVAVAYLAFLWLDRRQGALGIALPLGMAYYTLRLIHYCVEADRGGFRAHSFTEYCCYQFFPATLPVGPITRFDAFLGDLRRRRWDADAASAGASRMLIGAAKVVVVGNFLLAKATPPLLALAAGSAAGRLYVETVLYWLNIYVQFSGWSDIAIGFGAVLGFAIPENFRFPFLARNIGEFWRRWHITLSSWCRDYVYMPAMANWRRAWLATAASMVVLGLWHEVSLHYLIWGLYHATGLTIWRAFDRAYSAAEPRLPRAVKSGWSAAAHALTLNFVMFSYPTANLLERQLLGRG
jgi:D-alanyl-lipoteichoic acid acyltransferase DltB (MBOAT superfamily)